MTETFPLWNQDTPPTAIPAPCAPAGTDSPDDGGGAALVATAMAATISILISRSPRRFEL